MTASKKVVLARYHDGTAKNNWGGRATSLALAGVIARRTDVSAVNPLNGRFITEPFGDFTVAAKVAARAKHAQRRLAGDRSPMATRPFAKAEEWARQLLKSKRRSGSLERILAAIDGSDELWMNGEGDFILNYSGTLWRSLIIMHLAQLRGRPVSLVNCMLSSSPGREPVPEVVLGVGRVLELCDRVVWRDPESQRVAQQLFPGVSSTWVPDALFAWAGEHHAAPYTAGAERLPLAVQALLPTATSIVTISGTSTVREFAANRAENLRRLVGSIQSTGRVAVIAATSDEDEWMASVATDADAPFVPASVPLAAGMTLLARSDALVSGRYHPTILAACVGTGAVMLGSNSHKSRSLLEILGERQQVFDTFDRDPDANGLTDAVLSKADSGSAERPDRLFKAASLSLQMKDGLAPPRT